MTVWSNVHCVKVYFTQSSHLSSQQQLHHCSFQFDNEINSWIAAKFLYLLLFIVKYHWIYSKPKHGIDPKLSVILNILSVVIKWILTKMRKPSTKLFSIDVNERFIFSANSRQIVYFCKQCYELFVISKMRASMRTYTD